MADESKRIVIVVEGDQAGQEPVDTPNYTLRTVASTTTETDLVKEDFARRMDELAANFESTFGNLSDLPQLKGEKITPDDPDTEDIDLLTLTDKAEEANRLLQQIADELIQDESDSGGMGGGIGSPPQPPPPPGAPQQETFDDALRSMAEVMLGGDMGGVGGSGGGSGGSGGSGGGGGPDVGGIIQGAVAGGATGGPPGAIIGGILAGAGGGGGDGGTLLGILTGGPLAALVQIVDSLWTVTEQIHGILMDIDAHILSLADDIRGYSGDVAAAEAERDVMRINWQVDRANAIGPDVGAYLEERNELEAHIAAFVTELETYFMPAAVEAMKIINNTLPPILQLLKDNLWLIPVLVEVITRLAPGLAGFLDAAKADREKELDLDIQKLLFEFVGGAGAKDMNPPDVDKPFPAGAGVFF